MSQYEEYQANEQEYITIGFMDGSWLKLIAFVLICIGFYSVYETFLKGKYGIQIPYGNYEFKYALRLAYPWICVARAAICFLTSALLLKQTRKEK